LKPIINNHMRFVSTDALASASRTAALLERQLSNGFVCSQLIREELLLQKAEVEGQVTTTSVMDKSPSQVPLLMEVPGMSKLNVQLPRNVQCAY
jgi:hypothetical protein